jgi:hypothetical protein
MTEKGQYPLVYQLGERNGIQVPVGLAEASSLTFQSLSATTISATSYANLPTFGGSFTGITTVCAVGVCGTSPIQSITGGNTLNLRNLYFNLGNFLTVTPGTDITITYNQPLAAIRGGTGALGGNSGEIPYWDPGNALTSDPTLSYDTTYLLAPKFDTPGGYYIDQQPLDLPDLNSVCATLTPGHNQILSFDTGVNKWTARNESTLASLPVDPCAIIFNDTLGNPDSAPGDLTYHGGIIRFPNAITPGYINANSFVEGGTALSTKYQAADTTLTEIASVTVNPNSFIYSNGTGQLNQQSTISSDARSFLSQINDAAMRSDLGLGTISTKSVIVLDSADVCNTLPVTKGGTGLTTFPTQDGIVYANAGALTQISQPTGSDKSLKWTGAAFTWATIPTGTFVSPTDPCAIVFVNNAGNNIISDPDLTYNSVDNTLNVGNVNAAGYILADGNIGTSNGDIAATNGDVVAAGDIKAVGAIYEGGITSSDLLSNKYQGKDPTLTTIANITTAADILLYFSASDGAATTTITTPARQLLDDSSFATMRTTLGLGTLATKSAVALNSADVCNTLPVTNGGTGRATLTSNSIIYGNGTGNVSEITAPITNNTYLRWNSGFSWAAAGEQWTHVFKTSNEKYTSTSYASDSALAATTVKNNNYIIKYNIYFSANTTNGLYTQVDLAPGFDSFIYRINYIPPGTTVDSKVQAGSTDAFNYQGSVANTGAGYLELDCVVTNIQDTSVPIQFKLASSGGLNELHILKGSHLKYTTF